jgi:hypothetical protein
MQTLPAIQQNSVLFALAEFFFLGIFLHPEFLPRRFFSVNAGFSCYFSPFSAILC